MLIRTAMVAAISALLTAPCLQAQGERAAVTGVITDLSQAVVPGP